jgi:hypothetical protein
MHGVACEREGRRVSLMRRFGWQIGGISIAVAMVVALGLLAFGRGSGGTKGVASPRPSPSPHATPTVDPRVAEVEAAARRYVEAVEESARTGNPSSVDQLVVHGSQAEGNAAISADFSRENHYNFISSRIDFDESSWRISVEATTATVSLKYAAFGHNADWPSLRPREADHETTQVRMSLEFEDQDGKWLVSQST